MSGPHQTPDPWPTGKDEYGPALPFNSYGGMVSRKTSPEDETCIFHFLGDDPPARPGTSEAERAIPPDLINHPRYAILQYLGSGGMGTVYKAQHRLMERLVALKIISLDLAGRPLMVERFRREVKAAARLSHPNIVAAYDADQAGDTHFLVMEFVEGVDLDHILQLRGRLPVARACDYTRQAALGLQHAWECGMVHRDIKPHNLMLTSQGQVKILDFGLSRFLSEIEPAKLAPSGMPAPARERSTAPSKEAIAGSRPDSFKETAYADTGAGTADYIAPEEAVDARRADIRADIYSLGCTLYRFLSGRVPFPDGDLMHKIRGHVERMPEPLCGLCPELPARLCQLVERMMAKDPAQRYQTPVEVARALAPFAVESPRPILIVDDDPITRTMMADIFETRGYPVIHAGNGQEALDRLRRGETPCLIVLDLIMPVMDGWEFMQRQRQEPALARIPVVIVSAADTEQAKAMAVGAADYLHKPVASEELAAKVVPYADSRG